MALQREFKSAAALAICAVVLSATAFFFGNGLHPHWWLTWLAPIPVLLVAFHGSARQGCLVAFFSFFLGSMTWWSYFQILEIPTIVRILAFVGPSLVFTLGVLLARLFLFRRKPWLALVALPATWVSFEYLMSLGRNGTALNLSYSQMNFLPILQVASVTGIWGIEFAVLFFASAVAIAVVNRHQPGQLRFAVGSVAVLVAVLAFGGWRLSQPADGRQVTIGLASTNQRPLLAKDEADTQQIVRAYSQAIDQLAAEGAEIVLVPEKIGPVSNTSSGPTLDSFRQAAERNHVTTVVGVDQHDQPLKHNLAFVYGPDGNSLLVYEKHFMVPHWENGYERGNQIALFPTPHPDWGVVICKDLDFPSLSRQYSNHGARLIFAPAWDFVADDWLHGRMAVLRGVESGFAIARSAKQGLMTISDSRGRILVEQHSGESSPAKAIGTVTLRSGRTLYSRWGDWFAWLNLAGFVGLVVARFVYRKPLALLFQGIRKAVSPQDRTSLRRL
jgi:apolipoprotein N-acyltransferase